MTQRKTRAPLQDDLTELRAAATTRGSEFENKVAELLRAAGFEVIPNARTAKPRQTDLFAGGDGVDLLVEAKNRKRELNAGDIDALRSRLGRTASDIVGAVFTTSGLTRKATEAIEADRRREVLVFLKEEIDLREVLFIASNNYLRNF